MADRKRSIRFKIFAILLVPVSALMVTWAFTATLTIEPGLQVLRLRSVHSNVVVPTAKLISELQRERFLSVSYLNSPIALQRDLNRQRAATDAAAAELARLSDGERDETPPAMWQRVQELLGQVDRLTTLRTRVDGRRLSRLEAIQEYSAIAETGFQAYDGLTISPDLDIAGQAKAVILIMRSHELVSQESALVTGTVAVGHMTQDDRDAFTAMAGQRRLLYRLGVDQLDEELAKPFTALNASPIYASFLEVEHEVERRVRPGRPLPISAIAWSTSTEAVVHLLTQLGGAANQTLTDRAGALAQGVLYRIGAVGVLGLAAVLATGFVSFRFGRRLTGELIGLQRAALDLADRRLPDIVARLRRGEDVDVAAETPAMLTARADTVEVENVGKAFTSVQRTAVEAAVGQAALRKGVNEVFRNLARRNQSLLRRQLALLDELESEITDPDVLEKLFGVDHLTTRMRRHAEGLIILSGATPGRGPRDPVSLFDVVRAAAEEIEDYLRVDVIVPHGYALIGNAVTGLVHLLAELIENAAQFSPPHTRVRVRGEAVARGFTLEVEDRGLGIGADEMARLNARLADPPEFDLADSGRLGLFVVGRLARRHGIRVSLRPSPYGGTSAVVLLPQNLIVAEWDRDLPVGGLVAPRQEPVLHGAPSAGDTPPRRVRRLAPQPRHPETGAVPPRRPAQEEA